MEGRNIRVTAFSSLRLSEMVKSRGLESSFTTVKPFVLMALFISNIFGRWQVPGGRWKVACGRLQVEGGNWHIKVGRWQLAVDSCKVKGGR